MEKRGFGRNQAKNEPHSASGWERFLFWLIKEAKKAIDGWIIDQKCDSFFWLIK
jgi:hypothetical protein